MTDRHLELTEVLEIFYVLPLPSNLPPFLEKLAPHETDDKVLRDLRAKLMEFLLKPSHPLPYTFEEMTDIPTETFEITREQELAVLRFRTGPSIVLSYPTLEDFVKNAESEPDDLVRDDEELAAIESNRFPDYTVLPDCLPFDG